MKQVVINNYNTTERSLGNFSQQIGHKNADAITDGQLHPNQNQMAETQNKTIFKLKVATDIGFVNTSLNYSSKNLSQPNAVHLPSLKNEMNQKI